MMDIVQKEKFVSVNFSHAMFSLLSTHDISVMYALVWLSMVWLIASYANLKKSHKFKHQIWGKISSCIQVNTAAESNRCPHSMLLWDTHYHSLLHCYTVLFWDPHSYTLLFWDPHSYALLFLDPHSNTMLLWDPHTHTVLHWDPYFHTMLL